MHDKASRARLDGMTNTLQKMARKFPRAFSTYRLSENEAPHVFLFGKTWRKVDIRLTVKWS